MKPPLLKLTCALAAVLLASCSIKEDRSGCPCYLILDVDAFVDDGFSRGGVVAFRAEGLYYVSGVDLESCYGSGYVRTVPRAPLELACASGVLNCTFDGSNLRVPSGSDADALMSFACRVTPDSDELTVRAVPHKQHCRLHMIAEPAEEYSNCEVMLTGSCSGLDLLTLEPVAGELRSMASHDDGSFEAVLLRQDDDAVLELSMLDGGGAVLYTIDLSEALKEASYDWNKEDLDDVTLRIDYAQSVVSIEISEWDSDENYRNVEI